MRRSSRSDSLSPPQIPYGSPTASACVRHWVITGQRRHISLARISRCARARPRSPSGWKNIDESTPRQTPCICQSQMSAFGPGSCCGCGNGNPSLRPDTRRNRCVSRGTNPSTVADDHSCTQRRRASEFSSIAVRCAEPHMSRQKIYITFIEEMFCQRIWCYVAAIVLGKCRGFGHARFSRTDNL